MTEDNTPDAVQITASGVFRQEKGQPFVNTVSRGGGLMLAAVWLMLSSLLYSLQLST